MESRHVFNPLFGSKACVPADETNAHRIPDSEQKTVDKADAEWEKRDRLERAREERAKRRADNRANRKDNPGHE